MCFIAAAESRLHYVTLRTVIAVSVGTCNPELEARWIACLVLAVVIYAKILQWYD